MLREGGRQKEPGGPLTPALSPSEGERENGRQSAGKGDVVITFELPLTEKLPLEECLALVAKQGYQRLLINGQITRLDEVAAESAHHAARLPCLTVIQDRVALTEVNRARFVEACVPAYHFGQ